MHICLITAPTITEYQSLPELQVEAVQNAAVEPQLGILSVAALLEQCGDRPDIVDVNEAYLCFTQFRARPEEGGGSFAKEDFAAQISRKIVRANADVYGFSSICSTYPLSLRIASHVKQLRPHSTIVFGGPQASVVDVGTLRSFPCVDLILRGEVEKTLPLLLDRLQTDRNFDQVPGLTYRNSLTSEIRRNPNAPVIEDLDEALTPAYHLSTYLERAHSASIELGRGCPFSCTFCSTNDFFRRRFRLRSPERVLRDMRAIADKYGIRHFELVHDMFTVDRKRVVAFCEAMLDSRTGFTWDCSARTDCVDEELLTLMAQSGCTGVFFGIETGSRRMQRIIDKDLDPDWAESMLDAAQRLGMKTTASLILGFPEEQWSDVRDTVRIFMHSARCDRSKPQVTLLAPLAGTPVLEAHRAELELDDLCSDMSHQGLSHNGADLDLIRKHPDIFPNFYLIPLQHLDRDVLFELREFLTMATGRFRWLLCAIDQATDLMDFFNEWRAHRLKLRGTLVGSDLRRFYVSSSFAKAFPRFVRSHPISDATAVDALLQVEEILGHAVTRLEPEAATRVEDGDAVLWDDLPSGGGDVSVMELSVSLEAILDGLRSRTIPSVGKSTTFYAARQETSGVYRLAEISKPMAQLIRLCNGTRTIQEVVDRFDDADDVPRLFTAALEKGFLKVYRQVEATA